MKKLIRLLIALSLILLVGFVSGIGSLVSDKLLFYARVARLYAAEPPAQISMPLTGVKKSQIANTWQAPRGSSRRHQGQDIFAKRGTSIYSATQGYVYRIGENELGGQTVTVIGAGGRVYYYAHLDSYAEGLAEGDYVTPKTKLGSVGTTGNAQGTPPHLHFGVYTPTGAINPLPLLADRLVSSPQPNVQGRKSATKSSLRL
jgi:murein DD-endopeptidase MepM/ murein hydrolase activator NlpD